MELKVGKDEIIGDRNTSFVLGSFTITYAIYTFLANK